MKFTFGVCTTSGNEQRIKNIISSIEKNNIPPANCEIIVIGNVIKPQYSDISIKIFPFDESKKDGWITKKKNIITKEAKYENIVFMHDYVTLEDGWYQSMCQFGNEWNLLMNKIINYDGTRFRDWILCGSWTNNPFVEPNTNKGLLPYDEKRLSNWMYFSGTYWIAKREFMLQHSLDESLLWGQGEDVEWSLRAKNYSNFSLNENAVVKINKPGKSSAFDFCDQKFLDDVYDLLTADGRSLPTMVDGVKREEYFK